MMASETPGSMKRFRSTVWPFQETFRTPLENLPRFVAAITSVHEPPQMASVTIDEVVFEPKYLISLLGRYSLPAQYGLDWCIVAAGQQEVAELLEAALSDWVDFSFVPTPMPFVIYADHDEFTTFYTDTKSVLDGVVRTLSGAGFERVPGYVRTLC